MDWFSIWGCCSFYICGPLLSLGKQHVKMRFCPFFRSDYCFSFKALFAWLESQLDAFIHLHIHVYIFHSPYLVCSIKVIIPWWMYLCSRLLASCIELSPIHRFIFIHVIWIHCLRCQQKNGDFFFSMFYVISESQSS